MSVKKQIKNNETTYWWGYSTQINWKTPLSGVNIVQNWMGLYGQDIDKPTNFLNFMCQYVLPTSGNKNPTASHVIPGTAGTNFQNSCGPIDIAGITAVNYAGIKGDQESNSSTQCPHDQRATATKESTYYQTYYYDESFADAAQATSLKGWYTHTCYNYRASSDNAQHVKGVKVGNTMSYRGGYKIWANGQTSTTSPIAYGSNTALLKFTLVDDSATALFASMSAAALAISSLAF